jgi:hypothetical protein
VRRYIDGLFQDIFSQGTEIFDQIDGLLSLVDVTDRSAMERVEAAIESSHQQLNADSMYSLNYENSVSNSVNNLSPNAKSPSLILRPVSSINSEQQTNNGTASDLASGNVTTRSPLKRIKNARVSGTISNTFSSHSNLSRQVSTLNESAEHKLQKGFPLSSLRQK